MLMRDGIRLFKLYLSIGREMQLKRFHERRHDPLKLWKLTDMDIAAMQKWDEYSEAQQDLFRFTHTKDCPWTGHSRQRSAPRPPRGRSRRAFGVRLP